MLLEGELYFIALAHSSAHGELKEQHEVAPVYSSHACISSHALRDFYLTA